METQCTRRDVLKGLAGLFAITSVRCMPARKSQRQGDSSEEQRIYNSLEFLSKSDPAEFEKSDRQANTTDYCDRGVRLNYLFSPESPGEGRGRYVISHPSGDIMAGYMDKDKSRAYCFGWNPKENIVIIAYSNTAVKYKFTEKGWTKSTAPFGKGDNIKSERDINQNEHAVPDEEAMRLVNLAKKIQKIFPAK